MEMQDRYCRTLPNEALPAQSGCPLIGGKTAHSIRSAARLSHVFGAPPLQYLAVMVTARLT